MLIVCFLCFNPRSSHKLSLLRCLTQLLHLPYAAVEILDSLAYASFLHDLLHVTARKSGLNGLSFTSDALKPVARDYSEKQAFSLHGITLHPFLS